MSTQGTENHLALAAELREAAPSCREYIGVKRSAALMEKAAAALEGLAELDPDIEVLHSEN